MVDFNDLGDLWFKSVVVKGTTIKGQAVEVNYDTHEVRVEFDDDTSGVYKADQLELAHVAKARVLVDEFLGLSVQTQRAILLQTIVSYYNSVEGEWGDGDSVFRSFASRLVTE